MRTPGQPSLAKGRTIATEDRVTLVPDTFSVIEIESGKQFHLKAQAQP